MDEMLLVAEQVGPAQADAIRRKVRSRRAQLTKLLDES